eukprot:jgi/Mesvir1/12707/Mv01705-RA.1
MGAKSSKGAGNANPTPECKESSFSFGGIIVHSIALLGALFLPLFAVMPVYAMIERKEDDEDKKKLKLNVTKALSGFASGLVSFYIVLRGIMGGKMTNAALPIIMLIVFSIAPPFVYAFAYDKIMQRMRKGICQQSDKAADIAKTTSPALSNGGGGPTPDQTSKQVRDIQQAVK